MRLLLAALTVWCSFSCRPLLAQRLLSAPFNYASPWHIGRLQAWKVWNKEGETPTLASASKDPENGGVTVERTYRHDSFDGWSLDIVVLEPVETKTFDFEFRDVELP